MFLNVILKYKEEFDKNLSLPLIRHQIMHFHFMLGENAFEIKNTTGLYNYFENFTLKK